MDSKEIKEVIIAIIILGIILSISYAFKITINSIYLGFAAAALIILINIFAKKAMAFALDSGVEHELWRGSRYGIKPHNRLNQEITIGAILALFLGLFSLGFIKFMSLLTYETRALKHRAAKRFGFYSFTEMTDWHNGVIGATGIVAVLILAIVLYFIAGSDDRLWRFAIYYAFWNMIPVSKLDGTQIFFGSKILYSALGIITLIATTYAIILP
jgi:hypothetical protein